MSKRMPTRSAPVARLKLGGTHRCACGKSSYSTRKLARRAARVNLPGQALQAYLCERDPLASTWHYGHPHGGERA
jgi:hypothetical protein